MWMRLGEAVATAKSFFWWAIPLRIEAVAHPMMPSALLDPTGHQLKATPDVQRTAGFTCHHPLSPVTGVRVTLSLGVTAVIGVAKCQAWPRAWRVRRHGP
jgi:hypothetical protein